MENQQPPIAPQIPVQPVQAPTEPKKSLPKWPILIAVVLLILIFGAGAYLLGKNQTVNQKPASKIAQIITPTPTKFPPAVLLDTSDWKTYSNNYFSFKYPGESWKPKYEFPGGDWQYKESPLQYPESPWQIKESANLIEISKTIFYAAYPPYTKTPGTASESAHISIGFSPLDKNVTLSDWLKTNFPDELPKSLETFSRELSLSNEKAISVQMPGMAGTVDTTVVFIHNNIGYALTVNGSDFSGYEEALAGTNFSNPLSIGEPTAVFNTILSTFKFTDQQNLVQPFAKEGESCGVNAGAGGNAQCASGLICANMNSTTKIGTCVKE